MIQCLIFNFYISGAREFSRDSQSQRKKEKVNSSKVVKFWWAHEKFG
jgi:hypothetical protein